MIKELYLRQAFNIRKRLLDLNKDVTGYQNFADNLIKLINQKTNELKSLQNKINEGKIKNIDIAKKEIEKIILDIENEGKNLNNIISKFDVKMKNLTEAESTLHKNIKQTYPELKDEQIKKEIFDHLKSMNLS